MNEEHMMRTRNKPEVLAPAGNLRGLKTAVDYGADAVYCGGKAFGMRSAPRNLSLEDFEEGSRYAHERGALRLCELQRAASQRRGRGPEGVPGPAQGHRRGRADRHRHRRDDGRPGASPRTWRSISPRRPA